MLVESDKKLDLAFKHVVVVMSANIGANPLDFM